MRPGRAFFGVLSYLALGVAVLSLLAGCGTAIGHARQTSANNATASATVQTSAPYTITMPSNDIFTPYIAIIPAGAPINWINADTVLHTVIGGPTSGGGVINPQPFQLVLQPGDVQTMTLRSPGLYYYYCGAHATPIADGRAASMANTRAYPLAMDGFIDIVGSGLSGLTTSAVTMTNAGDFSPWMTVVDRGASVTWTNATHESTTIATTRAQSSLNPTPLAIQVQPGASVTQVMSVPGVYDYYSTQAATLNTIWNRPSARPGAPGYPSPMEGVILVLG